MKLAIIAAMGNLREIGHNNQLPWHLSADLKYFKQVTMGKPIIMGRKTYESIGRILPGRQNIVVTRNSNYHINDTMPANTSLNIVHNLSEALAVVDSSAEEAMIIGGSTLFNEALPQTSVLYLTYIHANFACDTFFPAVDENLWEEVWRENHCADLKNPYDYSFVRLEKKC